MPEEDAKVVNIHYNQRVEGLSAVYNLEALAEGTAEFYKALIERGVPDAAATALTAVMLKPARETLVSERG